MKKIILGVLTIAAGALLAFRIASVNKDIAYTEIKEYKMQKEAPIGENIFMEAYEKMDGYSITVKEAEIFTYDAFLKKFDYDESRQERLFQGDELTYPEMVCSLKLTVKNSNTEDDPSIGIDFLNYALYGTDFQLQISELLYAVANPKMKDGMMRFCLRPETEMDFYLPFYFSPSGKVEPIQVEELLNGQLYLPISIYPEQRRIMLQEIKVNDEY